MKATQAIARFVRDEEAATAAEYGIIAALMAGAIVITLGTLGTRVSGVFTQLTAKIKNI